MHELITFCVPSSQPSRHISSSMITGASCYPPISSWLSGVVLMNHSQSVRRSAYQHSRMHFITRGTSEFEPSLPFIIHLLKHSKFTPPVIFSSSSSVRFSLFISSSLLIFSTVRAFLSKVFYIDLYDLREKKYNPNVIF